MVAQRHSIVVVRGGCDGEEAIVKAVSPITKPESTLPFLRVHSPVGLIVKPLHSALSAVIATIVDS